MAECECELSSQSEHQSPGIVQDEESLVRVIYSPDQINTDGTLISANFNKDEFQRPANGDPPKEGFSTFRAGHATDDQIRDLAASQMIKLPSARKEAWAFKAAVADLRQPAQLPAVNDDGTDPPFERVVCVVDVALCGLPSHAEIWGSRKRSPSQLRLVRDHALTKFQRQHQIA